MRRSVGEGVNSRFVTGDRVESILKVSLGSDHFAHALLKRHLCRKCPIS
jgi:hypothetical protein